MCLKIIFLGQVDKWYELCQIDRMLVVEVKPWSIRQSIMNLVKWIVWYCLVKLTMLDGGKSFLVK